ncbi:hypothetical protein T484DRAFT_2093725 [Baffinella frigidus]|nr:hypothetical protein T484DRAFT_2093725 [Cryptophyta sp. CCMP2293]
MSNWSNVKLVKISNWSKFQTGHSPQQLILSEFHSQTTHARHPPPLAAHQKTPPTSNPRRSRHPPEICAPPRAPGSSTHTPSAARPSADLSNRSAPFAQQR